MGDDIASSQVPENKTPVAASKIAEEVFLSLFAGKRALNSKLSLS